MQMGRVWNIPCNATKVITFPITYNCSKYNADDYPIYVVVSCDYREWTHHLSIYNITKNNFTAWNYRSVGSDTGVLGCNWLAISY